MSEYGADGGVSVVSNLFPAEMVQMASLIKENKVQEAKAIHDKYENLMNGLLSVGCNPIAVKTIMAMNGQIKENFRLPLCSLNNEQKEQLRKIYSEVN